MVTERRDVEGDKRCDDVGRHVAEVQTGLLMLDAGSGDNLAQQRSHRRFVPISRDFVKVKWC